MVLMLGVNLKSYRVFVIDGYVGEGAMIYFKIC